MNRGLNSLREGDSVWLWEDGAKAEYLVGCHDYEAERNGPGYTLLVRAEPLSTTRNWHGNDDDASTTFADCDLHKWLETEYTRLLELEDRSMAAEVLVPKDSGKSSIRVRYFVLGWGEIQDGSTGAGTPLDANVRSKLWERNGGRTVWARENTTSSNADGEDELYPYCWKIQNGKATYTTSDCQNAYAVQPCFAVKAGGAIVLENGTLRANTAPEVVSEYFGSDTVLTRRNPFRVPYRVTDADWDDVYVTERVDGTYLRSYYAQRGATQWCTVEETVFDKLDDAATHTLTVNATDGAAETEKQFQFMKAASLGYVVYIGKITGTEDGKSYYWTERQVLHNAADPDAPFVLDPELELTKNDCGSLTFTLPTGNPAFGNITLKKSFVSVEADGAELWCGFVTEMTPGFDRSIKVYCKGELALLEDRDCVVEDKTYTVEELVKLALDADEDFGREGKSFLPGKVTVEKPESEKDTKESKEIRSGWDLLQAGLTDNYGGYLRLRKTFKMENGKKIFTRYLDYLRTIDDRVNQSIAFGVNMLDLSYYLKVNTLVNRVKVIGFMSKGWWIFAHPEQLEVVKSNEASIAAYGLVERVFTVDGTASTQESLEKIAQEKLDSYKSGLSSGLTLDAADLADAGVDVDRLEFLKNAHVISAPHGLDDWVLCTGMTIPLDALDEKQFTFGDTTDSLTTMQATSYSTAGKAWTAIRNTIAYVKNENGG